jgi:hypothetical protein
VKVRERKWSAPKMAFSTVEFVRDNMANVYLQMEGMLTFLHGNGVNGRYSIVAARVLVV